jgi:DNA-binding NarL/FixJ family response regulator
MEERRRVITSVRGFPRQVVQVLIVEDFQAYRAFVVSLLREKPSLQIVCEVEDGLQAVARAQELSPDLILLDIGLPGLNGIETARQILKIIPESRIVFLTQETASEVVHEAFNLGAWGYVVKSQAGRELLGAIEAVLDGKRFVSSGLDGHLPTATDGLGSS